MWQPGWEGVLGANGHMYVYGWAPLHSPETITMLLIDYTPIWNKKFKKKKEIMSILFLALSLLLV